MKNVRLYLLHVFLLLLNYDSRKISTTVTVLHNLLAMPYILYPDASASSAPVRKVTAGPDNIQKSPNRTCGRTTGAFGLTVTVKLTIDSCTGYGTISSFRRSIYSCVDLLGHIICI